MKRRIITSILLISAVVCMNGCGGSSNTSVTNNTKVENETTVTESEVTETTSTQVTESTEEVSEWSATALTEEQIQEAQTEDVIIRDATPEELQDAEDTREAMKDSLVEQGYGEEYADDFVQHAGDFIGEDTPISFDASSWEASLNGEGWTDELLDMGDGIHTY